MKRKYFISSSEKTARLSRLIAKAIDMFIAGILSIFLYPVGVILATGYFCIADSLQFGQSIGKKFIGLAVISLENGHPCTLKQSFIRNLPIIIPLFFSVIPIWGWIFSFLIGIPLILLEIYLIMKLDSGNRLGDVMADTTVMANDGTQKQIQKRKQSWFNENSST